MKRTHKRIFGVFGLVFVAAITFLAACLPNPITSAAGAVTDTITIRVVGSTPDVNIAGPESDSVFVTADQTIEFNFGNVDTVTLLLTRTDPDGTKTTYTLTEHDADYVAGDMVINVNLNEDRFGYGEYVAKVIGEGAGGVTDEDSISFSYYPVVGEVGEDEDTGETYVDLDYDPYGDEGTGNGEVVEIEINVYYEDGHLVDELSPIHVDPPEKHVVIPFDDYDLPAGTYTIEIAAYNQDGDLLYVEYRTYVIRKEVRRKL